MSYILTSLPCWYRANIWGLP